MASPDKSVPELPPSLAEIELLARVELARLPERFSVLIPGLLIRVEDFPEDDVCEDMGLESPFEILGLYQGVSLDQKSLGDVAQDVDKVLLYRRPLLDYWCETGESLSRIIGHVLVHEIGHHFGYSDADMEAIEASVEI